MKTTLMIGSLFILPTIASYHFFKDYFGNETKNLDLLVDHSRFGTNNYGLEWGAITDELIETKLKTGDLIFYYKIPSKLSFQYYSNLLFKRKNKTSNCYNSIALVVKTNTMVLLTQVEYGKIKFIKYDELLRNSAVESIKIRFKKLDKDNNKDISEVNDNVTKEIEESENNKSEIRNLLDALNNKANKKNSTNNYIIQENSRIDNQENKPTIVIKNGLVDLKEFKEVTSENSNNNFNREDSHTQDELLKNTEIDLFKELMINKTDQKKYFSTLDLVEDYYIKQGYCYDSIKRENVIDRKINKENNSNKYSMREVRIKINDLSNKSYPLCLKPVNGVNYKTSMIVRSKNLV